MCMQDAFGGYDERQNAKAAIVAFCIDTSTLREIGSSGIHCSQFHRFFEKLPGCSNPPGSNLAR